MKCFSKEVDHALIDKGMKRTDLAKELKISDAYLSDILNGRRASQPQIERIKKFLKLKGKYYV